MKTTNQIIGENLKRLRETSGFTQEQIARMTQVERSTYSNYEGGIREIPYSILEKLSDLFGCEPDLLFEDNALAHSAILASAFRIADLEQSDLQQIADFKAIVKSYLKMVQIARHEA